jgi:hypothetical protein
MEGEWDMLYRTLLKLIERGMTGGLSEKIDIFFAAGKLTEEEYNTLVGRLEGTNADH